MRRLKHGFLSASDVLVFIILMFIKVISLNFAIKVINQSTGWLILGCLGSVILIASITSIFPKGKRLKLMILFDIIISCILMIDLVYNRYFYDVTSVALIKQAGLAGEVKSSVGALIHVTDFLYLIDIIALIPLYKIVKARIDKLPKVSIKFRAALLVVLMVTGYTLSYNSVEALNKSQPGILKTLYDKKYVVATIGDLNFHVVDFYKYLSNNVLKNQKLTDNEVEQVNQWYKNKNKSIKNIEYAGKMKGKNLIVVQLEAFQGFVLNTKVNGQEITPNLNKLAKDSKVFDNYFYETSGGGTSDAEFLSNVSLLPVRDGSVYYQYANNEYDSMPKKFKEDGYYTSVMHSNRPGFWNRSNMYKSLGFDVYENEKNYNIDDVQGMGLSDKSFFKQSVEKMTAYKQPFYSFMITLSSHFPFKDSNDKIKDILNVGEFEGTLMGDYLKSVKYTDEAIGEFVNELKAKGLWDNSVVVFYGDHLAIPSDKKDQIAKLLYNKNDLTELEWRNAQKVVMMMHFPKNEIKGHSDITAGQMDLYPTIANLFGFKADYAVGQDLLNAKNGFYLNRDGVWADNNAIYLKDSDKVVNIKTGKEYEKNDYVNEFQKTLEYYTNSDATIIHNLIPSFKKK